MRIPKIVILRADLKETNLLLSRIASALELAAGITQPGVEAKDADREVVVGFSTDADLLREEWTEAIEGRGNREQSAEEEPEQELESAFRRFAGR